MIFGVNKVIVVAVANLVPKHPYKLGLVKKYLTCGSWGMLSNPKGFVIAAKMDPPRLTIFLFLPGTQAKPIIHFCSGNEQNVENGIIPINFYQNVTNVMHHKCNLCFSCSSSCWHTSLCWLGSELLVLPPSRSLYTLTSGTFARMLLCWRELRFAWIHVSMVRRIFTDAPWLADILPM